MLFAPCNVGALSLANRVAMAPMTRSRAQADGTPTPMMVSYYGQRSAAGLIITEGTSISAEGQGFLNVPGIFTDAHVAGWRPITERIHASGSVVFMQLWHVGRIAHADNMTGGCTPVAPSDVRHERTVVTPTGLQPVPVPTALDDAGIRRTIADYARAAERAVAAGCDGVEIHAANGYLPSQFLHESSNLRNDAWGGSIEKRARFLVEVTAACAAAVGAHKVGVRLTPFSVFNGAQSTDDAPVYGHLIPELAKFELGYLHVVGAEVSGNQTVQPKDGVKLADVLGFTRPLWPHALVAAGSYDLKRAGAALREGKADVIAFGRDFIGNPDLVDRLRLGKPLAERRPADWYGAGEEGYTDYPCWDGSPATRGVAA